MDIMSVIINGLSIGSIYAIIALGYTMVYGIAKMLNFAHGDVIMVGAYTFFAAAHARNLDGPAGPLIAVLIAIVLCALLGMAIEFLAYRSLRQAPSLAVLITAIGVSYLLQNVMQTVMSLDGVDRFFKNVLGVVISENNDKPIFGADTKMITDLVNMQSLDIHLSETLTIPGLAIVTIAVNLVIVVLLSLFVNYTKMGKAMRSVSEDRSAAQLMGININRTITVTFAIGSALAAIAGILYCAFPHELVPTTGSIPGIKAFIAAVIGGIGSIPGALIGGLLLGFVEQLSRSVLPVTELTDAVVYSVLIIVLLFRPTGLLGKKIREKV